MGPFFQKRVLSPRFLAQGVHLESCKNQYHLQPYRVRMIRSKRKRSFVPSRCRARALPQIAIRQYCSAKHTPPRANLDTCKWGTFGPARRFRAKRPHITLSITHGWGNARRCFRGGRLRLSGIRPSTVPSGSGIPRLFSFPHGFHPGGHPPTKWVEGSAKVNLVF